jgi:hypothetical protein
MSHFLWHLIDDRLAFLKLLISYLRPFNNLLCSPLWSQHHATLLPQQLCHQGALEVCCAVLRPVYTRSLAVTIDKGEGSKHYDQYGALFLRAVYTSSLALAEVNFHSFVFSREFMVCVIWHELPAVTGKNILLRLAPLGVPRPSWGNACSPNSLF